MTNTENAYSLTGLCAELDLSPSWVKKIEHYLGLRTWGSGQRGKKSFYSDHQLEFFRKIAILRFLGYGLDDIKTMFDGEMKILNMVMENFPKEGMEEGDSEDRFTPVALYLLSNVYCGPHGIMRDNKKYEEYKAQKNEEALVLDEMLVEYKRLLHEIVKVFKHKQKYMRKELKTMEDWL